MSFDRSLKPKPEKEFSFSLPEIKKFKLDNGLKVLFVKKNELPIVQLNLILNAGSKFDPDGKKGLSNLTAMMVDEGAGNYNALELSDEFDKLGSNFNISCNQDSIFLSLQTLSENFEKSLELFSTVITKPHFKKNDFEREQRKLVTKILQLKDDPEQIADIVFNRLIFGPGNSYSFPTMGLSEEVKIISTNDVKDFYKETFLPSESALIVVGDSTKEQLEEKLNKHLSSWNSAFRKGSIRHPVNSSRKKSKIYLFDKPGSVQSEIRIGHISSKRNEKNYYSILILNAVLGGQFSSRINLNLRENKGYTYGAFSRFSYYKKAGYFYISTSVGTENTNSAVKEIVNELNKIRIGVTKKELQFAKSSTIRRFPSNFETYKQIAANLTAKYIFSLPDNYFNNYIKNVKNASLYSVNKAAVEFVFPDEAAILIVGDKERVSDQLNDITGISSVDLTGEIIS